MAEREPALNPPVGRRDDLRVGEALPTSLTAEGSIAKKPETEPAVSVEKTEPRDAEPSKEIVPEADAPQPLPIPIARLVPKLRKSAKLFEEGKKIIPNSTSSLIRVAS